MSSKWPKSAKICSTPTYSLNRWGYFVNFWYWSTSGRYKWGHRGDLWISISDQKYQLFQIFRKMLILANYSSLLEVGEKNFKNATVAPFLFTWWTPSPIISSIARCHLILFIVSVCNLQQHIVLSWIHSGVIYWSWIGSVIFLITVHVDRRGKNWND